MAVLGAYTQRRARTVVGNANEQHQLNNALVLRGAAVDTPKNILDLNPAKMRVRRAGDTWTTSGVFYEGQDTIYGEPGQAPTYILEPARPLARRLTSTEIASTPDLLNPAVPLFLTVMDPARPGYKLPKESQTWLGTIFELQVVPFVIPPEGAKPGYKLPVQSGTWITTGIEVALNVPPMLSTVEPARPLPRRIKLGWDSSSIFYIGVVPSGLTGLTFTVELPNYNAVVELPLYDTNLTLPNYEAWRDLLGN